VLELKWDIRESKGQVHTAGQFFGLCSNHQHPWRWRVTGESSSTTAESSQASAALGFI
jgi:hypothetical protein